MENNKDETTDSSPEEDTSKEDTSKDTSEKEGSKTVPYNRFKEVVDQKNEMEEKNKKLDTKLSKLEEAISGKEEKPEKEPEEDHWRQKVDLKMAHPDLQESEINFIKRYAKGTGVSLEKAYNMDEVQTSIEAQRKKVEKENASASPTRGGVETSDEGMEVDEKELKENTQEVFKKAIKSGKSKKRKELGI